MWGFSSGRRLATNLGRGLVGAQPLEARMAQPAVTRPLGERDRGHQVGAGPVGVLLADRISERRRGQLAGEQLPVELQQQLVREPGADLAGVPEPMVVVVVADEDRAETNAGSGGVGPAADHELLTGRALELLPVR